MIRKCENYKLRNISGNYLLICKNKPINNIWVFELNQVGSVIWENCDKCKDVDELVKKIVVYFQEPLTNDNMQEIYSYLCELQKLDLVKGVKYAGT